MAISSVRSYLKSRITDENSSFYDLQVGNTNYASTQADFINHIAVGSNFRFKEDPTNTIYTILNVEIFHRIRYETLQRQALTGMPASTGNANDYDLKFGSLTPKEMFKYQMASLNGSGSSPTSLINDIGHSWKDPNKGTIGEKTNWEGAE